MQLSLFDAPSVYLHSKNPGWSRLIEGVVIVAVGSYADIVLTKENTALIVNRTTGYDGHGKGGVRDLLTSWNEFLTKVRDLGIQHIKCSLDPGDERFETRRAVYERAGWVFHDYDEASYTFWQEECKAFAFPAHGTDDEYDYVMGCLDNEDLPF